MISEKNEDLSYFIIFVSATEFSELMDISEHILYHLIEKNKMTYLKINRTVRIPISLVSAKTNYPESISLGKRALKTHYKKILHEYDNWLSIQEVCDILSVSKSFVKRLLGTGEIDYYVWHHTFLTQIKKSSLIDYLVNHTFCPGTKK